MQAKISLEISEIIAKAGGMEIWVLHKNGKRLSFGSLAHCIAVLLILQIITHDTRSVAELVADGIRISHGEIAGSTIRIYNGK